MSLMGGMERTLWLEAEVEKLRSDLTACQLERDRLRAGLLGHACFCGPTDPDPSVHHEDCPYRKWAQPEDPEAARVLNERRTELMRK